jgi:quinoprotein glucose dehydrogenase
VWGGINWDGFAWLEGSQTLIVSYKRLANVVRLYPDTSAYDEKEPFANERMKQEGSKFYASRAPFVAPSGVPCTPPPWSAVTAIHFGAPQTPALWTRPLGTVPWLRDRPGHKRWGSLAFGSPLVTAGGLVFIAASQDDRLRALALRDGSVLWEAKLSAGGQAGPMTYLVGGKQYIVIAAGGRAGIGTRGSRVIAFALP